LEFKGEFDQVERNPNYSARSLKSEQDQATRIPREYKIATFALTRGYHGFSKVRYIFVIRRNRALRRIFDSSMVDHILFHEGNISSRDQSILGFLSGLKILFVSIEKTFVVYPGQMSPQGSQRDIGYRLMCRFQYFDLWSFLKDYDYVYRVDEDCLVTSLPSISDEVLLLTGALSAETHDATNGSLVSLLQTKNLESYYDHLFPYTNCYLTKVSFWLRSDVREFLFDVASHNQALVNRWGDLPVMGVALKAYGGWSAKESVSSDFDYRHLSHNSRVYQGQIYEVKVSLAMKVVRTGARIMRRISGRERP
jgi:hypothetical protein